MARTILSLTALAAASCVGPMGASSPSLRPTPSPAQDAALVVARASDASAPSVAVIDLVAQSFDRSLRVWVSEASRSTERSVSVERTSAPREVPWERGLHACDVVLRDDASGLAIPVRVWATRPTFLQLPWRRRVATEHAIEEAIAIHTVEAWLEAHRDVQSVVRYRLPGWSRAWGVSTAQSTIACVSDEAPHGLPIEACWAERAVIRVDERSFERVSAPREMLVGRVSFIEDGSGATIQVEPNGTVRRSHGGRASRSRLLDPIPRAPRPSLGPLEFLWAQFEPGATPAIVFSTETLVARCERDGRWRCQHPRPRGP
ncbi:MAG: hypothetical protein U0269_11070 [Polyangiales bacterium]